jgi:hypothetical protein
LNVPWIAVPFEVIDTTSPLETLLRKYGLYGTRTRDAGWVARWLAQKFTANSASTSAATRQLNRKRGSPGGVPGGGAPPGRSFRAGVVIQPRCHVGPRSQKHVAVAFAAR